MLEFFDQTNGNDTLRTLHSSPLLMAEWPALTLLINLFTTGLGDTIEAVKSFNTKLLLHN